MRVPMVVESVANHIHIPTGKSGISARCRMALGFPIAVGTGSDKLTPVYADVVVDFIGPSDSLREGQLFDIELRDRKE